MILLWVACTPLAARAEAPLESYAVLIGSNVGGEGQRPLAHAEADAERMAALFGELGRIDKDHVTLLRQPSAKAVEQTLSRLKTQLQQRAVAGQKTQVLFYYSGHARAQGLSLGREELSLATLRTALSELPSTLTVVVLDACQSGAFSGVKGASPAADFSVASVHDLHSRGIAVLASSTASELSQESPELLGSYFTHHLTVGLRGPGDVDGNGRVSLDEAYRYAYDRTLSDTARTQIGVQHATLETNLTGRGDVALTYPGDADATLFLPSELEGRVLVQRSGHGTVLAELIKVAGTPLSLALPSGRYDVLLREDVSTLAARECSVALVRGEQTTLQTAGCRKVVLADPNQKGQAEAPKHEVWFAELGLTGSAQRDDGYVDRLDQFRFQPHLQVRPLLLRLKQDQHIFLDGAFGRAVHPNLSLLVRFDSFEKRGFVRKVSGPNPLDGQRDEFEWRTRAVSVGARGRLSLWQEYIVAVAELSVGLGITRSDYDTEDDSDRQWSFGPALRAAGGFTFGFNDHFGVYLLGGYAVVRALRNELGDTHDDGGFFGSFGLRVKSLKGWW